MNGESNTNNNGGSGTKSPLQRLSKWLEDKYNSIPFIFRLLSFIAALITVAVLVWGEIRETRQFNQNQLANSLTATADFLASAELTSVAPTAALETATARARQVVVLTRDEADRITAVARQATQDAQATVERGTEQAGLATVKAQDTLAAATVSAQAAREAATQSAIDATASAVTTTARAAQVNLEAHYFCTNNFDFDNETPPASFDINAWRLLNTPYARNVPRGPDHQYLMIIVVNLGADVTIESISYAEWEAKGFPNISLVGKPPPEDWAHEPTLLASGTLRAENAFALLVDDRDASFLIEAVPDLSNYEDFSPTTDSSVIPCGDLDYWYFHTVELALGYQPRGNFDPDILDILLSSDYPPGSIGELVFE